MREKQHTMPDTCCAVGCQNRRNKNNPEVSFYRSPSDKTKGKKEHQKKWIAAVKHEKWPESDSQNDSARLCSTCISLPVGTNGKPLAAIGKFSTAIGKLMISKTLATNGEEITNAMIGNDVLANYW